MTDPRSTTHLVPRGGWRLPFDVVAGIMAASPPSIISAFMKSCHALYAEGPKHILQDGVELDLDRRNRIVPFANFMLAEGPSRFAHFRKLDLSIGRFCVRSSPTAASRLVDLLAHPSLALETLILRDTEVFLGRLTLAPLYQAISRLLTIKHLVLPGMGIRSTNILQILQSKLESLSISVAVDDSLVPAALSIVQTLRSFSNSLHTLLIRLPSSNSALSYLVKETGPISFPCVKTFGIVYNPSVPDLITDPTFAQTFPAITNLKIIPSECPTTLHTASCPTSRRFQRACTAKRNEILQRRAGIPPGSLLRSLLECSGGLLSAIYPLAFDHRLLTLRLWQPVTADALLILYTVLEDTCPQHLCLSTHVDDVERVYTTLRAFQIRRIDLNISLFNRTGPRARRVVGNAFQREVKLRSLLESFIQPLPTGLGELNLTFDTPFTPRAGAESMISGALAEFTRWASTAAPSLIFTYTLSVDKGWEWPDLGQRHAESGIPDDDVESDNDYYSPPWDPDLDDRSPLYGVDTDEMEFSSPRRVLRGYY